MFSSSFRLESRIRFTLLSLLLLACAIHAGPSMGQPVPPAAPRTTHHNILLLYSYGHGSKGVEIFNDEFRSVMNTAGVGVNQLFFEYLDLERNKSDSSYRPRLRDFLLRKYADRKIDLVVTGQQPALEFLLQEGKAIAPGAPAITVQAPPPAADQAAGRRFASQLAQFDIKGTLELALKLFPGTRRVVFVSGSSDADRKMAAQAANVAAPWQGRLELENTSDLALEDMRRRVAALPPHSIIIFTQYNRDTSDRVTVAYEVERMVAQAANAPVFGLYDFNLTSGGIGGSVFSVRALGASTARLALDLLDGRRQLSQAVTSIDNPVIPMFDWAQIERWGGDPKSLPGNSIFVNRTPSLWERYQPYWIGVIILVLVQSLSIAALLVHKRRRLVAEQSLQESEERYRILVEQAPDAIVVYDADSGHFVDANAQAERLFGCSRAELLEGGPERFYPPARFDSVAIDDNMQETTARALAGNQVLCERTVRNAQGRELYCELRLARLPSLDRRLIRGSLIDITERKSADAKIKRLNNLYAALSQCNQAIVRCIDQDELFPQICSDVVQFGGMKMAWIGLVDGVSSHVKPVSAYGEGVDYLDHVNVSVDPDNPYGNGAAGSAIRDNQPFWCQDYQNDPRSLHWLGRDPRFAWGGVAGLPLHKNGRPIGAFVLYTAEPNAFDEAARKLLLEMAIDISYALDRFEMEAERVRAEAQRKLAAEVFEQSSEGIVITDAARHIVMVNHAFTTMTGYGEADVLGQNPRMLSSGRQDADFYRGMWDAINSQGRWQGELWNNRKDGSSYPEWLSISRVLDAAGAVSHYIGTFSDITRHKAAEEHMQWLSHFDTLTGLPNRVLVADRTKHTISMVQRSQEPLALMLIDLDHFKNVNDSLGHRVGDAILKELAKRLTSAVREQDTVSRPGGDEFILVLPGTDAAGAAHLAEKLLELVVQPYRIEQHELRLTPSIGIAMYPGDGPDFDSLSKCADVAMYRAKQHGRNNYCFFTSEMQERSVRTLQLENAMRRALERDEFSLHYQPQVSMRDGCVIGAEALLRWRHPELGMVSPAEFIPIAEDSGQILPIGEWVLRSAVRQWKAWSNGARAPMTLAVNLSAVQFHHPHLVGLVMQILEQEQLAPEFLELELTEGGAMDNPLAAIAVMDSLHARGIRMSIDDFGTGYSSLSYLKRFKIAKLKIDQSFVRDIADDPNDRAIVGAVISLARSLGLQTIAEGVETEEQLVFLREKGCDEAQGYYFSRPLPADQFEAFLKGRCREF